ncbi:MAG: helix-turn-helix domain-containing protein [Candidatus Moranbacteria bacterium]|nr:helix-turn-helix domain-containing protein [Candidatus Moranbacteria bacterium]
MDKDLIKLLEQTGFTQKEAAVYLALLELSQGTVTEIAKITKLKRSIIYVLLEGLIKRGYASELPDKKISVFQATDPSLILFQLKATTKNFSEMLPMFRTLHNKGKRRPKITYHETKEGIWKAYESFNLAPEAFFISSYEKIEKHFPGAIDGWVRDYHKNLIPVKGKHLVPNNPFEIAVAKKLSANGQQARYLSEIPTFNMDFSLCENKLAITSLEDEPFIVVIESEELVKSIRPIFEMAWNNGKEIK